MLYKRDLTIADPNERVLKYFSAPVDAEGNPVLDDEGEPLGPFSDMITLGPQAETAWTDAQLADVDRYRAKMPVVPAGKVLTGGVKWVEGVGVVYAMVDVAPPGVDDYKNAIVHLLDTTAQARRYDGAVSLATYVGSTIPAWNAEALAFTAWRDQVWAYTYTELEKVMTGQREQPSVETFLFELPVMIWPD